MLRRSLAFLVLLLVGLWPALAGAQSTDLPTPTPATSSPATSIAEESATVDILKVSGIIDRPVRDYLLDQLKEAEASGHQVLIQLESPGMLGVDAVALAQRFYDAKVPVLVWVGGRGATAEGGAVLLVYASSIASVAPGSGLGLLSPVDLADEAAGIPPEARASVEEWVRARGRGSGLERIANEVLTAQDAIDLDVVPELQPDLPAPLTVYEFLDQVDGKTVPVGSQGDEATLVTRNARDIAGEEETDALPGVVVAFKSLGPLRRVLHTIVSPSAVFILLSFGLAGIAFELTQPGFGFAGIAGVIATLMAVVAMLTIPPSWLGLAVFLVGIGLLWLDVIRHSLGVLSVLGVVGVTAGAFLLYPDTAPSIAISPWLIWPMVLATIVYYGFSLTVAQQARDRVSTVQQGLIGLVGEVRSDLNPVGGVVVKGTVWRAKTVGEHLESGMRVRVRGVDGMVLRVEAEPAIEDDEIPSDLDDDEPDPRETP